MMADSERSFGALLLATVALGVLAASVAWPWMEYDYSSGRRTPDGGLHDPNDTGLIRHHIDFGPNTVEGNVEPTDADGADRLVLWIAVSLAGAALGVLVMVLAELRGLSRFLPRKVSLVAGLLGLAALAVSLLMTWFWLPDTLSGYGITSAWHYEKLEDGYIRDVIGLGWIVALCSVPFTLGALAFKFQAGATDPEAIEDVGRRLGKVQT